MLGWKGRGEERGIGPTTIPPVGRFRLRHASVSLKAGLRGRLLGGRQTVMVLADSARLQRQGWGGTLAFFFWPFYLSFLGLTDAVSQRPPKQTAPANGGVAPDSQMRPESCGLKRDFKLLRLPLGISCRMDFSQERRAKRKTVFLVRLCVQMKKRERKEGTSTGQRKETSDGSCGCF